MIVVVTGICVSFDELAQFLAGIAADDAAAARKAPGRSDFSIKPMISFNATSSARRSGL